MVAKQSEASGSGFIKLPIHNALKTSSVLKSLGRFKSECNIHRCALYEGCVLVLTSCCGWSYLRQNEDGGLVGYFWRWLIQRSGWPPAGNVLRQQWGSEILMWWREARLFSSRGLLPHISITSTLFLRVCAHSHLNVWPQEAIWRHTVTHITFSHMWHRGDFT